MIRRTRQEKIFYYTMPRLYSLKIKELDKTEEKVAWLLKKYEPLRNSDKLLLYYYWVLNDSYKGELDDNIILALTPAESITRARRHLQKMAKEDSRLSYFLPTYEDVILARDINERAVREWAISSKAKEYDIV